MSHNKRSGFTLIELMLAMSFISVLLIAITLTILQISTIYNKGLTLKEVNTAGQTLASELQRSIAQTTPFSLASGAGSHYIIQTSGTDIWGGRLCLGQYSYVWNYGAALATAARTGDYSNVNVYTTPANTPVNFIKVYDPDASYCSQAAKKVVPDNATELLSTGDHNLAIHNFTISSASGANDAKTGQALYVIGFTIGTNDQSALMHNANGEATGCEPPSVIGADPAYCSVNVFNIVARAGNTVE